MLSLKTNLPAGNAGRQVKTNTQKVAKGAERLSSGYRINRAADDAAGLAMSEKMRWMIRGLNQGAENTMDGISWCQVGDGAMDEINDMVHRMTELAVKGANGTLSESDRQKIDAEIRELKKQINTIGQNTSFNEKPVFDNSYVSMDVDTMGYDMQIFNAAYDSASGEAAFGGIIYKGERITWDSIDPDMVSIDPATGEQIFKGGMYSCTAPDGTSFTFTCENGAKVPDISFRKNISANTYGLVIDDEVFPWEDLLDENGNPCTPDNIHGGSWGTNYHGATFSLYIPEDVTSYDELIDSIIETHAKQAHFVWGTDYIGNGTEQAVDAQMVKSITLSQAMANEIAQNGYSFQVRADKDGIWLENNSAQIPNSKKTWADLGITSWDSGSDISSSKNYSYSFAVNGNPYFSFDFTLSDITSVDSVIDGIDGMLVNKENIKTNYKLEVEKDANASSNLLSISASASSNLVTFDREYGFGRDFDSPDNNKTHVATGTPVSPSGNNVDLTFTGPNNSGPLTLNGSSSAAENRMDTLLDPYLDYVESRKIAHLLAGGKGDPFQSKDLQDVVGKDNITSAGYFKDILTIDPAMKNTDGDNGFAPGQVGSKYPTAYIDFKDVKDLADLEGTGFDSTCKTCSNHYSIVFENNVDNAQTVNGLRYSKTQDGNNYTLKIDIASLKANNIDGSNLADALVQITSKCFDFHYTQYASENGSKLYIYDNRQDTQGAPSATFYTKPFSNLSQGTFNISTTNSANDRVNLNYTYDFSDASDIVSVSMDRDDANGSYYKTQDANGNDIYILVQNWPANDPTNPPPTEKYQPVVTYKDSTGAAVNKADAKKEYTQNAIQDMLSATNLSLDAQNYTTMGITGDEKSNVAIRAEFNSYIKDLTSDNGIDIKHSGISGDKTTIPRFPMNTVVLGLYAAGSQTIAQAEKTLGYTKKALEYVSTKRSLYGAYQNRLEHTYNNNLNSSENTSAAESRIRDADMATEMVSYSNNNIIRQAAMSMLSQANQQPNSVLQLLQE